MKITSLTENPTVASAPTNSSQAPEFGRSDKFLEEEEQIDETTSGAIASVATPVGATQRRAKGSMFAGIKTSKKFANSESVNEAYGRYGRRDAYQRDYDSSVAGMGKHQSLAYQLDGGANDEGWDEPQRSYQPRPAYQPRPRPTVGGNGMYFYNVPAGQEQQALANGLKQTRTGKWFSKQQNTQADSVFGKGRYWEPKNESVSEAVSDDTDLKSWQVVIMNNYYRGKYSDYSGRYYYVLASSPEEAKKVVLDNADGILKDLLSMKSQNGRKILPRGSAVRITPERIGAIKDGTVAGRMTTTRHRPMFGPQGLMMVKLENGAISDVQGQDVAEGSDIGYHQTSGTKAGHTVSSRKLSNKPQASNSDVTLQSGSMHHRGRSYDFPKGTLFTQLPGGIFAKHPSVPETHPGYGHLIKSSEDNIRAIHNSLNGQQGVAEGLSKRDQKDVDAIKAAIERLQAQLSHPNADKAAIQQSIEHEKKRLALYGQGVAEEQVNEKSKSQAQFRTMAAVAHNPEFAKKVGISQAVGKEFHSADRKQNYKDLPKEVDEEKQRLDPKCWSGYKKQGTKMKGNTRVNNCVKVDETDLNEEDMLAQSLYKALDLFKKAKDKELGARPHDRGVQKKVDEVSSELLGRYKKGASAQSSQLDKEAFAGAPDAKQKIEKSNKRYSGIIKATNKQFANDAKGVKEGHLGNPGMEDSPVANALTRRILMQRTDLLAKYGPEKVMNAIDSVAEWVGDVDEIGSSDVSGWIRQVEQQLNDPGVQGVAEDKDPCWDNYKQIGTKNKNGKKVPNCVPKE